jgi:hypothetical protein
MRRGFLIGALLVALASVARAAPDPRYATDRERWRPGTLAFDAAPVDLSFLNADDRPAGRHGPIRARGDRLVDGAGREVRLWGTNLAAYTLFEASDERVRAHARRLAALGFNLVRLHHHDSAWVSPNVFEPKTGNTRVLREQSLRRLDWWVKCLNDEGLYVWLDLHVGRQFLPGDGARGIAEVEDATHSKSFPFVNPDLEKLMHQFATAYLGRKNAFTGVRVADNPGLLGVLAVNESDLNAHFGPSLYPGRKRPVHEGLFAGQVAAIGERLKLPAVRPQDTWRDGPGKLVLATLEADFFGRAVANLRALGGAALIAAGSAWGGEPWRALPPLAVSDVIDVHSYGRGESLSSDPRAEADHLTWIAGAQLGDRPLTVSEWGIDGEDRRDRFTMPLRLAAVAALQGWDAVMHFAYHQGGLGPSASADTWSSASDPSLLAPMPAAALLFRQGHVRSARRIYVVRLDRQRLYLAGGSPAASLAVRTLVEQSRVVVALPDLPELPWDRASPAPAGAIPLADLDRDLLPSGSRVVTSDTGELARDFGAGLHTIDTGRTQAAAGWIGGRTIRLRDVEIAVTTAKATVALSSLDGLPLAASQRMLLTTVAQSEPGRGDQLPYRAEPVRGAIVLELRPPLAPLTLQPLRPDGTPGPPSAGAPTGTRQRLELPDAGTHFYLLTRGR